MTTAAHPSVQPDASAILQLLLDAPALGKYYHFDQRPDRLPLRLLNGSALNVGMPALTAAGRPTIWSNKSDKQALTITEMEIGTASARLKFRYDPEGLVGTGSFDRQGATWALTKLSIAER